MQSSTWSLLILLRFRGSDMIWRKLSNSLTALCRFRRKSAMCQNRSSFSQNQWIDKNLIIGTVFILCVCVFWHYKQPLILLICFINLILTSGILPFPIPMRFRFTKKRHLAALHLAVPSTFFFKKMFHLRFTLLNSPQFKMQSRDKLQIM